MICAAAVSLWATPVTGGGWHDLWHPAVPCACWSVLRAGVRPRVLAIEESPYLGPALIVIVALALLGLTRATRRFVAFIRSITYGLLDRRVGIAAGVLLAMMIVERPGGLVWTIGLTARAAEFACSAVWRAIPLWWVLAVALAALSQPALSRWHLWRRKLPAASGIWSDDPLDDEGGDAFGRARLADTLKSRITAGDVTVVSLTGGYGEGKSTVLRFLERKLNAAEPTPIVVRFNAWLPEDGATLTASFLKALESAIGQRYILPRLSARTRDVLQVFLSSVPHAPSNVEKLIPNRSQSDDLGAFSRALARLPVPIVVLVDEIDRLNRGELDALFKLLFPTRQICASYVLWILTESSER